MKESTVAEQAAGDVEDNKELVAEANIQSKNDNEKPAEQAESDFQCDLLSFSKQLGEWVKHSFGQEACKY